MGWFFLSPECSSYMILYPSSLLYLLLFNKTDLEGRDMILDSGILL